MASSARVKTLAKHFVDIETFGGFDFFHDSEEVGWSHAIDGYNFDVSKPGYLSTRPGYSAATNTGPAASTPGGAAVDVGNNHLVIAYTTNKMAAYSGGGAAIASIGTGAGVITGAETIGTTTNSRFYIANGTDTVWRWDGAAFTQPAGMPRPVYLAQTRSNRLVMANFSAAVSQVSFSPAGTPEVAVEGSVDLAPGDGSGITGLAKWQDSVFAFKANRHFVFGPEGVDNQGKPVFSNRRIEGYGALDGCVTVGQKGVYFFDGRDVWRTTGGSFPERISTPIMPGLGYLATRGFASHNLNTNRLQFLSGKLYVVGTDGLTGLDASLVFDEQTSTWMYWTLPGRFYVFWRSAEYMVMNNAGVFEVRPLGGLYDSNSSFPIPWSYSFGYLDPMGGYRAVMRSFSLWGTGPTALAQIWVRGQRPADAPVPAYNIPLGTSSVTEGKVRTMARGVMFSPVVVGGSGVTTSITRMHAEFTGRPLDS